MPALVNIREPDIQAPAEQTKMSQYGEVFTVNNVDNRLQVSLPTSFVDAKVTVNSGEGTTSTFMDRWDIEVRSSPWTCGHPMPHFMKQKMEKITKNSADGGPYPKVDPDYIIGPPYPATKAEKDNISLEGSIMELKGEIHRERIFSATLATTLADMHEKTPRTPMVDQTRALIVEKTRNRQLIQDVNKATEKDQRKSREADRARATLDKIREAFQRETLRSEQLEKYLKNSKDQMNEQCMTSVNLRNDNKSLVEENNKVKNEIRNIRTTSSSLHTSFDKLKRSETLLAQKLRVIKLTRPHRITGQHSMPRNFVCKNRNHKSCGPEMVHDRLGERSFYNGEMPSQVTFEPRAPFPRQYPDSRRSQPSHHNSCSPDRQGELFAYRGDFPPELSSDPRSWSPYPRRQSRGRHMSESHSAYLNRKNSNSRGRSYNRGNYRNSNYMSRSNIRGRLNSHGHVRKSYRANSAPFQRQRSWSPAKKYQRSRSRSPAKKYFPQPRKSVKDYLEMCDKAPRHSYNSCPAVEDSFATNPTRTPSKSPYWNKDGIQLDRERLQVDANCYSADPRYTWDPRLVHRITSRLIHAVSTDSSNEGSPKTTKAAKNSYQALNCCERKFAHHISDCRWANTANTPKNPETGENGPTPSVDICCNMPWRHYGRHCPEETYRSMACQSAPIDYTWDPEAVHKTIQDLSHQLCTDTMHSASHALSNSEPAVKVPCTQYPTCMGHRVHDSANKAYSFTQHGKTHLLVETTPGCTKFVESSEDRKTSPTQKTEESMETVEEAIPSTSDAPTQVIFQSTAPKHAPKKPPRQQTPYHKEPTTDPWATPYDTVAEADSTVPLIGSPSPSMRKCLFPDNNDDYISATEDVAEELPYQPDCSPVTPPSPTKNSKVYSPYTPTSSHPHSPPSWEKVNDEEMATDNDDENEQQTPPDSPANDGTCEIDATHYYINPEFVRSQQILNKSTPSAETYWSRMAVQSLLDHLRSNYNTAARAQEIRDADFRPSPAKLNQTCDSTASSSSIPDLVSNYGTPERHNHPVPKTGVCTVELDGQEIEVTVEEHEEDYNTVIDKLYEEAVEATSTTTTQVAPTTASDNTATTTVTQSVSTPVTTPAPVPESSKPPPLPRKRKQKLNFTRSPVITRNKKQKAPLPPLPIPTVAAVTSQLKNLELPQSSNWAARRDEVLAVTSEINLSQAAATQLGQATPLVTMSQMNHPSETNPCGSTCTDPVCQAICYNHHFRHEHMGTPPSSPEQ
jgi:hypothetical protein